MADDRTEPRMMTGPGINSYLVGRGGEFVVNDPGGIPQNVATTVPTPRFERRLGLLDRLEGDFASRGGEAVVDSHKRLYGKAKSFMQLRAKRNKAVEEMKTASAVKAQESLSQGV